MTNFHKPGVYSCRSGKLGLTRGTCFVASCLKVAASGVLLCFVGLAAVFSNSSGFVLFYSFFFRSKAHGLLHVSGSLTSFTSPLISLIARPVRNIIPQTRRLQKRESKC